MTTDLTLDPKQTALLVMDFQVGLLGRLPGAEALLARAGAAVAAVRAAGGHVGWVRVAFTDPEFEAIPATSAMARSVTVDRRAAFALDAPATQIHGSLEQQPGDISVRKTRVGAFTTTDLDRQLREREIATLILAGVSTSGVVLSTVREAMDRDYQIVVLTDACADPDPATHDFLNGTLFPRHASLLDVGELASVLG